MKRIAQNFSEIESFSFFVSFGIAIGNPMKEDRIIERVSVEKGKGIETENIWELSYNTLKSKKQSFTETGLRKSRYFEFSSQM